MVELDDEVEDVAAHPAAEAVEQALGRADLERRGLLVVERAQALERPAAGASGAGRARRRPPRSGPVRGPLRRPPRGSGLPCPESTVAPPTAPSGVVPQVAPGAVVRDVCSGPLVELLGADLEAVPLVEAERRRPRVAPQQRRTFLAYQVEPALRAGAPPVPVPRTSGAVAIPRSRQVGPSSGGESPGQGSGKYVAQPTTRPSPSRTARWCASGSLVLGVHATASSGSPGRRTVDRSTRTSSTETSSTAVVRAGQEVTSPVSSSREPDPSVGRRPPAAAERTRPGSARLTSQTLTFIPASTRSAASSQKATNSRPADVAARHHPVVALGVPGELHAQVVLVGEEVRHPVVGHVLPEHRLRCHRAGVEGVGPVLDPQVPPERAGCTRRRRRRRRRRPGRRYAATRRRRCRCRRSARPPRRGRSPGGRRCRRPRRPPRAPCRRGVHDRPSRRRAARSDVTPGGQQQGRRRASRCSSAKTAAHLGAERGQQGRGLRLDDGDLVAVRPRGRGDLQPDPAAPDRRPPGGRSARGRPCSRSAFASGAGSAAERRPRPGTVSLRGKAPVASSSRS